MATIVEKTKDFAKDTGLEFLVQLGCTTGMFFAAPTGARIIHDRDKEASAGSAFGGVLGKGAGVAAVIFGAKAMQEYGVYIPAYVAAATNLLSAGYEVRRYRASPEPQELATK
ncbi:hypothetical protein JXB11_03270 [Candidatus Woesearchaeota archaeon]|nr:hypothetical protein [Candidatus Woesearchaeota archaeon]